MDRDTSFEYDLDINKLRILLTESPGVYVFKDDSGRAIYVGKAKNLKKRVLSYLLPGTRTKHPPKTSYMLQKAKSLEVILTKTEQEAFILESNLIKKFMPRYNVILRDDKKYPCLRLDLGEPYPRLSIVRNIKKDSAIYFGPFPSASSVKSTYRLIGRIFKLRKCRTQGLPKRTRPCLNYQMNRCLGPCVNDISRDEYHKIANNVRLFLEGKDRELVNRLKKEMFEASDMEKFETAARIRDQIRAIEAVIERRQMVSMKLEDWDIIGVYGEEGTYDLSLFYVRKGYVVGTRNYLFTEEGATEAEIIEAFLKQYYTDTEFIPPHIIISHPVDDMEGIRNYISVVAGKKVVIHRPRKGEKYQLVGTAIENARNRLKSIKNSRRLHVLDRMKEILGLRVTPRIIEALDISNFQGKMAVGAIVSFVNGEPYRSGYRNYRIKGISGIDDYEMMSQLINRRIKRGKLPDLFLVDGGKGHLATVKKAMVDEGIDQISQVISIAKADPEKGEKGDKIYTPERMNPIILGRDDPVLLLLMRIRDEVHRRAIQYYRKLAITDMKASELDSIPGVGKNRKKALLQHFRDVTAISQAGIDDLMSVPGINRSVAMNIIRHFNHEES